MKGSFAPKKDFQVSLARPQRRPPTPVPAPISAPPVWKKFIAPLLLVAVLGATLYYFRDMQFLPPTVSEAPVDAVSQIVSEVEKQYLLPKGETPTLAIITSLDELKGQEFFAKAQVGDAVLIYLQAKKGFLWRPSTRQVIEVGPVSIKTPEAQTETVSAVPSAPAASSTTE